MPKVSCPVRVALAVTALLAACGGDASTRGSNGEITLNRYACSSCRVVAESIAYLGHPDDTIALREDVIPSRDSRGRFYLADRRGSIVYVFGPNGRLLQSFGRPGRGPGEFIGLRAIFVKTGDTLLIVGGPNIHVVAPDYSNVREYRNMGGSVDEIASTILADGRILSGRSNHQFTLIDSAGGADTRVKLRGIDTSRCGECGERIYREASTPGTVWSGPLNHFRVEEHALDGTLRRRFTRSVDWFPEWTATDIAARTIDIEISRPRFEGARQSHDGTIWTHVSGIEHPNDLRGIDEDIPGQMVKLWERVQTHIDAIDPVNGELVAGTVVNGLVIPMTGDYSAQLSVDDAGGWAWKILRFRVEKSK